ncbi:MAG TPA: hypothetical protein VIH86_13585 [Puia sp.]
MKKTIQTKKQKSHFVFCLLLIAISSPAFASAYSACSDTAVITKISGNKNQIIQDYSGADKQTLFFSAKLKQKKNCRFYMFDMDGTLVAENNIYNKQGVEFTNMQKGNYYFEIFSEDERIENGTLTIK